MILEYTRGTLLNLHNNNVNVNRRKANIHTGLYHEGNQSYSSPYLFLDKGSHMMQMGIGWKGLPVILRTLNPVLDLACLSLLTYERVVLPSLACYTESPPVRA